MSNWLSDHVESASERLSGLASSTYECRGLASKASADRRRTAESRRGHSDPARHRGYGRLSPSQLTLIGTTTPISFVHDVLFPYASKHLESFLSSNEHVAKECILLVEKDGQTLEGTEALVEKLRDDIKHDRKTKALKHLQGLLWKGAYESGEIKGVFVSAH